MTASASAEARLAHPFPAVKRRPDGRFDVIFDKDGARIVLEMSVAQVQTLAAQALEIMPPLDPVTVNPDTNAYYRETAAWVARCTESELALLLREIAVDEWVNLLWFMRDAALMERVLQCAHAAVAHLIMQELFERWAGKDPDAVLEFEARMGHKAVRVLNSVAQHLVATGEFGRT